jgi:hypothetical protein
MDQTSKVFVLGNGESRKGLDLEVLSEHGRIYGCNGLYRDFPVDGIVCVDGGMMHEVYDSGYALTNNCYFRSWSKLPQDIYPMMVDMSFFEGWGKGLVTENEKGDKTQFVLNGTDPNQMRRLFDHIVAAKKERGEEYDELEILQMMGNHQQWITWCEDEDQVELIDEEYSGWSAGPIAVRIAIDKHSPSVVYLLGFDLNSNNGLVNNVYKGTSNYVPKDSKETTSANWIKQHIQNFKAFPEVTFYKVNPNPLTDDDRVSSRVEEWDEFDNVKYITIDEMKKALDI